MGLLSKTGLGSQQLIIHHEKQLFSEKNFLLRSLTSFFLHTGLYIPDNESLLFSNMA